MNGLKTNAQTAFGKALLIKKYENDTASNLSKCNNISGCIMWAKSEFNLKPNLSIIGNVSKSTGILMLNGENDSQTPIIVFPFVRRQHAQFSWKQAFASSCLQIEHIHTCVAVVISSDLLLLL